MAMNKVPTLVLGIGGIGCRIAAGISDLLSEEDRKYVGIIGIDTNENDLAQLKKRRIRTIQTSAPGTVRSYLSNHLELSEWFPVRTELLDQSILDGAGQIRAISRMAGIVSESQGQFAPIAEEIQRIRYNDGTGRRNSLSVMVVGSITGGTGAGLFLQLPFYVRDLVQRTSGLNSIAISGMFVSADITERVQPSEINRQAVHVNAYACIKELNAFFKTQNDPELARRLKLDWYACQSEEDRQRRLLELQRGQTRGEAANVNRADMEALANPARNIPYDYLYLIETNHAEGTNGEAVLGDVEEQISRILFTYLFTPVGNHALSVEINFALQNLAGRSMNRYASAGYCRLRYPVEEAKKYLSNCTVRDLVKDEWLILDDKYQDDLTTAQTQQQTDRSIKLPELGPSYVKLFQAEIKDGCLGALAQEAFLTVKGENGEKTEKPCYWEYQEQIDKLIKSALADPELSKAKNACQLNQILLTSNLTNAQKEVGRIYTAFETYSQKAAETLTTKGANIANALFPPSYTAMDHSRDQASNVYRYLSRLHPITGRFFCYGMIQELEKELRKAKSKAAANRLVSFDEVDLDPNEENVQTGRAIVSGFGNKKGLSATLSKVIKNMDKGKLERFATPFNSAVVNQCTKITNHLDANLRKQVYELLIQRFQTLALNYEAFFRVLRAKIQTVDEDIRKQEQERNNPDPLGAIDVFGDTAALRAMLEEYRSAQKIKLSEDVCKEVFEQLFRLFSDDFEKRDKRVTGYAQSMREQERKQKLSGIFDSAVKGTISAEVQKQGAFIYDMNVIEALQREYYASNLPIDDPVEAEKAVNEYIVSRLGQALNKACPMLATEPSAAENRTESIYVTFNPRCAVNRGGDPNVAATMNAYIRPAPDAHLPSPISPIMDEEFSAYELGCLRARYKLFVEDLTKYGRGSDNEAAYRERIANLDAPLYSNDPDAYKTVANPHLNRYWQENGFLPEILTVDNQIARQKNGMAFFYGLGYDNFFRSRDSRRADAKGNAPSAWYTTLYVSGTQILSCGREIGGDFTDLYQALPFNGRIRDDVLAYAAGRIAAEKGFYTVNELSSRVLNSELVTDLCQVYTDTGDSLSAERNIFDIILSMRGQLPSDEWDGLFTDLLNTIWDYCAGLFSSNNGAVVDDLLVTQTTRSILNKIFDQCSVRQTAEKVDRNSSEGLLYQQYQRILEMQYHTV